MPTATASARPLPRRPCLQPGLAVYQRAVDELQIGVDPRRGVVLADLPPRLVAVLRSLDGRTPLSRLLERASAAHEPDLRRLLRQLTELGLVVDAAGQRHDGRLAAATVVIRGEGALALAVTALLLHSGLGHLAVQVAGTVQAADVGGAVTPHDVGLPRRVVLDRIVQVASSSTAFGPPPADRSPDLVVLTDALVPAPETVRELMGRRQEHLVAGFRDGSGIVGPLVLPGRSACLHCADLSRADLDPRWPRVANQLAGRPQYADPGCTQATAALAATQVVQVLQADDEEPVLLGTTIQLDLREGTTQHRHWHPHPLCECLAGEPW